MDYHDDTIAAIATPIGVGGIGIIRVSGHTAIKIARTIFRSKRAINSFEGFRLYLGYIIDPESEHPVDEVLLSVMHAPTSYTREDIVEINSHSGYAVLSTILQIILQAGARLAKPGEFTLRAFLNGRIDLTQAEAVTDLINAKGDVSIRLATHQLAGGFRARIQEIRQALIEILAHIEASIDFPEEEPAHVGRSALANKINKEIIRPVKGFIAAYTQRKVWHEGITVVIVGRVNVGKSSILNRLLQEERAIVTPIPGTTRDILECMMSIEGIPVRLIDTAGMRKVKGKIEEKGVALTQTHLALADITVLVLDRSRPLNQHDVSLLQNVTKENTITAINKIDLPQRASKKRVEAVCEGFARVEISALTGEGFSRLTRVIVNKIVNNKNPVSPTTLIPNLRHKTLLTKAALSLKHASKGLLQVSPLELVAADLSWARDALDEITGERASEEILENIFRNFCLGK